jgi:Caspase domain
MAERRLALIIGTSRYRDPKLNRLRSPGSDARKLEKLLADDRIGGFETTVLINPTRTVLARKIEQFYKEATLDDLVMTHIGCHGVKDEDGRLYFAASDTELDYLGATSISSDFVKDQMERSRCQRKVLFLDCCYSGAFPRGLTARGAGDVDLKERFSGRGQVVLTASSAIEYAFERDQVTGNGTASVFTSALMSGLADGSADRDHDGWISVDELYEHIADTVAQQSPDQTPRKWDFNVQGTIMIARNPYNKPVEVATPGPHRRDSIAGPDLRPYAGVATPPKEHWVVLSALETSLAYQGRRVALDRQAYDAEMMKRARLPANEEGQYGFTRSDWVEVVRDIGVPSDPAGRLYRARVMPAHSSKEIVKQLEAGRPIVAIASIRDAWINPEVKATGRLPSEPGPVGSFFGFKQMLILAYDQVEKEVGILMPWPEWGYRGNGWIPDIPTLFNDYVSGADAIEAFEVV